VRKSSQNPYANFIGSAASGRTSAPEHTPGHKKCPACERANLELVEIDSDLSRLPFGDAARCWMRHRRNSRTLKEITHQENEWYISALEKFFGGMRICDITPGNLKAYQDERKANPVIGVDGAGVAICRWKKTAANSKVNHELCCLAQILQFAKLWARLKPYYFPLPIPRWSPTEVLSQEDEEDFFSIGASHPEAQLAYWVACITNNTTASGSELRFIRLRHVFLRDEDEISEVYISSEGTKNNCRPRKIALNSTAKWALVQLYKRALQLGSSQPDHFLLPYRCNRDKNAPLAADGKRLKWDPTRPAAKGFHRRSWGKLRDGTGQASVTPHKFRHQAITRLLENGARPETVRAIAGHVTQQMMEYYSHIRREAQHEAVMAIELSQKPRKAGPQPIRRSA
jgi:integrase